MEKQEEISNYLPRSKPYKVAYGGGLYLEVEPNGRKSWRIRYKYKGRDNRLTVGQFPSTKLEEARSRCRKAKNLSYMGKRPKKAFWMLDEDQQEEALLHEHLNDIKKLLKTIIDTLGM